MKMNKIMTTKTYVKEFKLQSTKQDLKGLYERFCEEWLERMDLTQQTCQKLDAPFSYQKFRQLVKEMDNKYRAISCKSTPCLTDKFWGKFFASNVIPARESMFPEEHQRIMEKKGDAITPGGMGDFCPEQ